jgi:xanthine dehydrogenase accessory factor
MHELLTTLENWFAENKKVALATVVKVYGSAPRGLGAKMIVNSDGMMAGSVSGGCVEGAVVAEALEILNLQKPKLIKYGVTQEQAFEVGLACGGIIEVFIEPLYYDEFCQIQRDLLNHRMFARVTVISGLGIGEHCDFYPGGEQIGNLKSTSLLTEIIPVLENSFRDHQNQRLTLQNVDQEYEVFLDLFPPAPRLVIIGAVHIAIPLVTFAKPLGFHTIVVDPRKAFSNRERFPHVDELIQRWPQEYLPELGLDEGTYLVAVSHDDKLDVPALAEACKNSTHYIGALGSKKTFDNHKKDLVELGISEDDIRRIHSPIGMNIGARGAEEIALSIITEIVAVRNGASFAI